MIQFNDSLRRPRPLALLLKEKVEEEEEDMESGR